MRRLTLVIWVCLVATTITNAQWYYKTPSGKKYHKGSCRMVENVSKAIRLENAISIGLTPCKICKPPSMRVVKKSKIHNTQTNKPRGESKAVRCRGYTKKGKRCKRRTRIGNGFCFQHNPDR